MLSLMLSIGKTAGAVGGVGWLAEQVAKYYKWVAQKAVQMYAFAKSKASGKETSGSKTLTEEGAGETDSECEGDAPSAPDWETMTSLESDQAIQPVLVGKSRKALNNMQQAISRAKAQAA
jgi:hypothetical protein